MNSVKLKLTPDKTEFIIIHDTHTREPLISKFPLLILKNSVAVEAKDLGVTFNSDKNFDSHRVKVCHAC